MNIQSKSSRRFSFTSLAKSATFVPVLLVLVTAQSVFAIDFYWDANGGTEGTGGAGTWDASSSFWRSGSAGGTLSLWPNTDPNNADTAQLEGTAGTLTLNTASVNINVNKIVFGTTGYTIAAPGSGTATLKFSGTTPTIDTGALAATISAIITGSAGLTKAGTGTLNLSGNNTYSGTTVINGFLAIAHNNALGASGAGNETTIAATGSSTTGPQLKLSNNINSPENITITGITEQGSYAAAIVNTSGANTLSGNITLSSPSGNIRLAVPAGSLTFSGTISQTGTSRDLALQANAGQFLTVNNAIANNGGNLNIFGSYNTLVPTGTVTLKGVSGSGIGNTLISQAAKLVLGVTDALNTTANLTLGTGASQEDCAAFDLAGFNQTVNALIGTSGGHADSYRTVINSVTGTNTLTVGNGNGSGTFNGQLLDGGAGKILALTKIGSGIETLTGPNTFSGGLNIKAGTVKLTTAATAAGAGTVTLGVANDATSGTLDLGGQSCTIIGLATAGTAANQTIANSAGTAATLNYTGATTSMFGGVIQNGPGASTTAVTVNNASASLTLSGANTYTGGTTISGGTLIMTSPCNLADGALNIGGNTFVYRPTAAGALNIGSGVLTLANGSTITTAIGGTASQSAITSSGAASLAGTGTVNIYGVPGVAHAAGVNNLITAGSGLAGGTYTLGKVYNNTDFTVSALTQSETAISTTVSVATPITTAYWKGGLSGANNVWAASDGSAGCNWVTDAGGGASAVVPGSAADVIFSANTVSVTPVGTTLGADMTIETLAIADTVNGLGLSRDGYTLTITPASAADGLTMNASVPASTIAAKVNLGADQTWTVNSANALIVSGIISGTHALTKAGTGTLTLTGTNTYSGGTTVMAGNLNLSSSGSQSSSGVMTVSGGMLTIVAGSGGRTLSNSMVLNGGTVLGGQDNIGSGGTIIVDGNGVTHIFTSSGSLVLPGAVTANELIVGGGGGAAGGNPNYNAAGGGGQVRNLSGQALSAGTTTVTVGAGGTGGSNVDGGNGTASSIGGNSANFGLGAKRVTSGQGGASGSGNLGGLPGGGIAGGGGGDSAAGVNGVNATGVGGKGGDGTASSSVAGLVGYGFGQASGGSAYFGGGGGGGGTTIGAGGLGGGGSNGAGTANTGGGGGNQGAGGSGIVVVQYPYGVTAGTVTLSGGIDLQSASTLDASVSGGLLDVTTHPITTSTGSGGLTIASSSTAGGVVRFGSSNTYLGDTTINSGAILRMNAVNAMPSGSGKGNVTATGTLDLNGNSTQLNGLSGNGIVDGTSGTPTLTVGNNDTTSTFAGVIQNTGGSLALTKTGTGVLTLSGANPYTGATTISAGTLVVNGELTASSSVNVTTSGATLKGTGTMSSPVTVAVGANLSPGNPTGLLTVSGNTTINGTLAITVDGTTNGVLAVSGNLDISGASSALLVSGSSVNQACIIATYGSLTGTFSTNSLPSGWVIDYAYNSENKIAIKKPGGTVFRFW